VSTGSEPAGQGEQAVPAPLGSTPAADGYRMPAEFAPHDGCYMVWPDRPDNWRAGAGPAQDAFTAVAQEICISEPVTMLVSPAQHARARAALPNAVRLVEAVSDDAWARDIGPTFVIDEHGHRRAVDWVFNAWGGTREGLYPSWDKDDLIAGRIAQLESAERYRAPFVLEGGAIHVDGEGTLITTAECLLNPNRNPSMTKAELEAGLGAYLGVDTFVWLDQGVYADETDGHVDNLIHVVAPGVVVLTWTSDRNHPQHARSKAALELLRTSRDAAGREFDVHLLPAPGPLRMTADEASGIVAAPGTKPRAAGDILAASYANFYIGTSRVVVPLLDERTDDEALSVIAGLFPDREVVGVPSREILLGGGNVHCITQQLPATRTNSAPRA
jgi:agmatine deiminase